MIQAKRILTVDNKTSRLDQPITLYKNDGGILLDDALLCGVCC